jgi:hypothetical protein
VFSLMAMLVLLGAAAKHSQFGRVGHHPHYLSQAVKMSQAPVQDTCAPVVPSAAFTPVSEVVAEAAAVDVPPALLPPVARLTPLLI